MFRRSSLNNIRFPEVRTQGEDTLFLLKFIEENELFSYSNLGLYHYHRDSVGSFTKQKWGKASLGYTSFYRALYQSMVSNGVREAIPGTQKKYLENLFSTYIRCSQRGYPETKEYLEEMSCQRNEIMHASLLNPVVKLDMIVCITFPKLGRMINFWYK